MAILKIVVTILIFVALLTYLLRKWLETAWFLNKWKAVLLGFLLGAIVGIVVYYVERIWLKIHINRPANLMFFYFLPRRFHRKIYTRLLSVIKRNNKTPQYHF